MRIFQLVVFFTVLTNAQIDSIALQLADAERSFSSMCEKEGIKNSFLTYFDDSCIMFNPHPVNGKELYANGPASSTFLSWYPVFVETAASGDFGISTGPWEIRKSKNDTVSARGYYFSVWEKKYGKEWKVTLDVGIGFPKEQMKSEMKYFHTLRRSSQKTLYPESAQLELENAEKKFIMMYDANGHHKAYQLNASENLRTYRDGHFPATHRKESLEQLKTDSQQGNFISLGARIASSGDMGYVYGYAVTAQNDSSTYVRVWRKENKNGWKIAVDILKQFKK